MSTRNDLHQLINDLPEPSIPQARMMIERLLRPPAVRPEIERSRRELDEFRKRVERQFQATQKPSTISGMAGGGFVGTSPHGGAFSNRSFHYWDGRAIVYQSLRGYSEQLIESMERLSVADGESALVYEIELTSGGKTVRHVEEFPRVKNVA